MLNTIFINIRKWVALTIAYSWIYWSHCSWVSQYALFKLKVFIVLWSGYCYFDFSCSVNLTTKSILLNNVKRSSNKHISCLHSNINAVCIISMWLWWDIFEMCQIDLDCLVTYTLFNSCHWYSKNMINLSIEIPIYLYYKWFHSKSFPRYAWSFGHKHRKC